MDESERPDPATARAALQATKVQMLADLLEKIGQVQRRAEQIIDLDALLAELEDSMDRIALTADEQAHWRRIAWRWKLERGIFGARFTRAQANHLIYLATLIDAGDYADDRTPAQEE